MEKRAIIMSMVFSFMAGSLAAVFAFATRSEVVMLDGIYFYVSFALAGLSLKIVRLIGQPDDKRFQFGYSAFEPMLNVCKGIIIGFVGLLALFSAIDAMTHGGRPIQTGVAAVYAVAISLGSGILAIVQSRLAKKTGSSLLKVDAQRWLIDSLIAAAVCLAFLTVLSLEKTALQPYSAYADPVMVISLVLFTAPVILKIILSNSRELLWGAPDIDLQHRLDARIHEILRPHKPKNYWLRLMKLGRRLYVHLYLLLPKASNLSDVDQFDTIREEISTACKDEIQYVTVDVLFTRQSRWAE